ncbi:unnamed protein product [Anisakis simplex]|uniref:Aquaporin-9 n=1 Tax=Anisakis simplex TaxID=6269 RepID=A0A0M3J2C1_ANISI|nr:unnamed protein product [Anisakis simplex]
MLRGAPQFGGCSSTAQYVLSKQRNNAYVGVCFGWGLSLVFAVYGGFHISGSHLNPAVSLFLLTMGRISVLRFVVYSGAQIFGAFVGAMITYFLYFDALNFYDGGTRQVTGPYATASIFATYPQNYLSLGGGLIDQVHFLEMLRKRPKRNQ